MHVFRNSEYDQDIPQSQTADKLHDTTRKTHTTITRHQEDKLNNAISSLFPIKMIAKLEWTRGARIAQSVMFSSE